MIPRLPNFKFLDWTFAIPLWDTTLLKLKLLENCEHPVHWKYPSLSSVFEMNKYQKMVLLIKDLEVISLNYFSFKLNY